MATRPNYVRLVEEFYDDERTTAADKAALSKFLQARPDRMPASTGYLDNVQKRVEYGRRIHQALQNDGIWTKQEREALQTSTFWSQLMVAPLENVRRCAEE